MGKFFRTRHTLTHTAN